jgi:hypothetical protein
MWVAVSTPHWDMLGQISFSEFLEIYHKGLVLLGKDLFPLGDQF